MAIQKSGFKSWHPRTTQNSFTCPLSLPSSSISPLYVDPSGNLMTVLFKGFTFKNENDEDFSVVANRSGRSMTVAPASLGKLLANARLLARSQAWNQVYTWWALVFPTVVLKIITVRIYVGWFDGNCRATYIHITIFAWVHATKILPRTGLTFA